MAFKMKAGKEGPMKKNFPGMYGMKSVEEKDSAMMMKKAPMKAAKPDFPDIDGDGNTTESMKKAAADKKSANKMKEAPMKMKKAAMKLKKDPAMKLKKDPAMKMKDKSAMKMNYKKK